MSTNTDHIALDPQHAAVLAELALQTGKSYQELVGDAIDLAFVRQKQPSQMRHSPEEQQKNLSKLLERMSQLPVRHPRDGLSGRDHDQILYGRKLS